MLAAGQCRLYEPCGVVEMLSEPLAPARGRLDERGEVERGGAHRAEEQVLVGQQALEARPQDTAIEQVLHAQPDAPCSIGVRRPDAPARGADLRPVEPRLVGPVQGHVVGHDHVGAAADADPRDVDPAGRQHVQLADQGLGIDDDPVPDDRGDVRVEHARWDEVELEDLVALDHRVAGVVAALVADNHRDLLGQEVGGLALALVAPLEADDDRGRHQTLAPTEP